MKKFYFSLVALVATVFGAYAGNGSEANPYKASEAVQVIQDGDATEDAVFVTGKIVSIKEVSAEYGNATFNISDDGKEGVELTIFRCKYLGNEKFTDEGQIKVGDEVVVNGKLMDYNGTPEMGQGCYITKLNGQGASTGGSTGGNTGGTSTVDKPLSVADVIAGKYSGTQWVEGVIVGWVEGQKIAEGAHFDAKGAGATNLLIAATANVTDVAACVPVQLPAGNVRAALNLGDNPDNLHKSVKLHGSLEKYFGVSGIKTVTEYVLEGQEAPVTPDPEPTPENVVYQGLVNNCDDWTFDLVTIPEGLDYIWAWKEYNGSGYLNGSAYKDGANASEAYAYTTVDLKDYADVTVTFDHAAKFQTSLRDLCGLVVRENGAKDWTKLAIPTWPEAGSWTFVNAGEISLKAYEGKKVDLGFVYGSTANGADTWEIKNFVVNGTNKAGVEVVAGDAAPAVYYNLQGVRVAQPTQGLYIVRQGNKTSKVLVK